MQRIIINQIKIGSFIKLFSMVWLSLGITMGLLFFVMIGLFGIGDAHINGNTYYGLTAGMISLIMVPLASVIIGLVWGIFAYLPFRVLMKILKKISIRGEFNEG
ncbi:MAG: hypothetical protein LLG02_03385 [Pelosinus sp.]|nr:hypothetical protein [Pelosinus sp.]